MFDFEAAMSHWVDHFRLAQSDLRKLREIGAPESEILRVMALMGFGHVPPDEFLAASTGEEIGKLISTANAQFSVN